LDISASLFLDKRLFESGIYILVCSQAYRLPLRYLFFQIAGTPIPLPDTEPNGKQDKDKRQKARKKQLQDNRK
jgi:hypothetical protein